MALCYKVVLTNLIQSWDNRNVTRLTTQGCNNIVISTTITCRQLVNRFVSTCLTRNNWVHTKNTQVVAGLSQAVNMLFLVVVTSLVLTHLIQSWDNRNVTRLMTQDCNNIVISWLYQTCWNNLATNLKTSTRLLQVVNSLFQTCWQLGTSSVYTTCWRLVGRLATIKNVRVLRVYTRKNAKVINYGSANKLLQICSQAVNKLCSHCLFPVVGTSLEEAVNNL
jgi:hypothetical protein